MKTKTRIISFFLALTLLFGCMQMTLFAVEASAPVELEGGIITEEDVAAGETDALTSVIPKAGGILSIDQLSKLVTLMKSNKCDGDPSTARNTKNTIGNIRKVEDTELGRIYRTVGAPTNPTATGNIQIYETLQNSFTGMPSSIQHADVGTYKGASFVISFDIRLDENFKDDLEPIIISSYASTNSNDPTAIKTIQPATLLTIKADGKLYIPASGSERPEQTLSYQLPKSTVADDETVTKAPFVTVAVHVNPKTNTYDVYADGVRYGKDIVFLTEAQQALIAAVDKDKEYTYSGTKHTSNYDFSETDFLLGYARMFANYNTDDWLKNLTGDVYSYDNLKLYYSDLYIECANHTTTVGAHTHDDANMTASALFTCTNCSGEWNVTVPVDQTGNGLCDLCEINNTNSDNIGVFHSIEEIKSFIKTSVGNVAIKDGKYAIDSDYRGSIKEGTENGNSYAVIGGSSSEIYGTLKVSSDADSSANTLKNYANTPYKGKSFVVQTDIRLGSGFATENQEFALFKIFNFCKPDAAKTKLSSLNIIFARISNTGELQIRNGDTGNYEFVCDLSTKEFTSIALHIKTAAAASVNPCGLFDVYVNGKLVKGNVQYLTEDEEKFLHVDDTIGGYAIKMEGIKDYCYGYTRLLHIYNDKDIPTEDVLHIDNSLTYFADTYVDDYTRHDMVSEHIHDYSKNLVSYSSCCRHCSGGNSSFAIIDANDDKLCDICMNESIDTTSGGIINPDDLAGKIGESNVVKATTITESTHFGFSSGKNTAGCITTVTDEETGNIYIQYIGKQTASGESYVDLNSKGSTAAKMLKNFDDIKGNSYVYSIDIRLGTEYSGTLNVAQTLCYMKPKATDENGAATDFGSLTNAYIKIDSSGRIVYRLATETSSSDVTVPATKFQFEKGADKFRTLSMHVRPREGDYGLYSIYIDGELLVGDIQFLTKEESESIAWTASNGKTSSGVKDFIPGIIRGFQITSSNSLDSSVTDFLSLDNPKLYYSEKFIECAKHDFKISEHIHDLESSEICVSLACPCGVKDEIRLPIDTVGNGKCDTCDAFILSGGAEVAGRQVVLGDLIGLKLYTKIHKNILADPTAKMIITYGENTLEFIPAQMTPNEKGEYVFDIRLSSIEMATDVSIALMVEGEIGNAYTTNVREYTMALLKTSESEYERELCRAMLNYGAYSQKYFSQKHSKDEIAADLANALIDEQYKDISHVSAETLADYEVNISGKENGTVFTGASLILDSKTTLKVFFTAPEGFEVSINKKAVSATKVGNEYFVEIGELLPQDLDDAYEITVSVGGVALTASVSVLAAVHALLISDESDSFKQLGRALYLYNLAAVMYIAQKAEAKVVVKNDAKGAAALVLDDGGEKAATYAKSYMEKYTDISVTFALKTNNYASFVKDSKGNYVMSEDGKFTYTQTEDQIDNTNYWYALLDTKDENGNALAPRVELISHSHTHGNPPDGNLYAELLGARHILQGLFGYDSPAFIAAGGIENKQEGYDDVKMEVYVASRGTNGSTDVFEMINTLSEFDKAKRKRLDSFMVQFNKMWLTEDGNFSDTTITAEEALRLDENGKADVSHVEAFIDCAMENGGLAAFCIHGIVPTTSTETSSLRIYDEQADAIFAYVQKHAETGDLWSTTYSEAVLYFCEWNTSELDVRRVNDNMLAISLTDEEDDSIFDMALTVKVSVDDDWTSVRMAQGASTKTLEVKGEAGARYVLVDIVPDTGIVTLTKV